MSNPGSMIIDFSADTADQLALVGGKGANLARMMRAKLPVPPGFVITTNAYSEFMSSSGLDKTIINKLAGLNYNDSDKIEAVTAEIRELVVGARVPPEIDAAIVQSYRKLAQTDAYVAVRSSGTAEDLAEASFAGMHDTYLDIRGETELTTAVRRCWASLWTARATAYRSNKGFEHSTTRLAVVVQLMVEADVAGVMFTGNPMTASTEELVINASWGLGESVVSGVVTPDLYVLHADALTIKERQLGSKAQRIQRDPKKTSGTITLDVAEPDRQRYALSAGQLKTLGDIGRTVTAYYQHIPQDIEWALAGDTFYLLQSRPITGVNFTWNDSIEAWQLGPDKDEYLWSHTWADEVWTGVVTPLMYTWRAGLFTDGHVNQMYLWDVPGITNSRRWQYHKGTVYYNCTVEDELVKVAWPPIRKGMLLHASPDKHEDVLNAPFDFWQYVGRHLRIMELSPAAAVDIWMERQYADFIRNPGFLQRANGRSSEQLKALSDAELAQEIKDGIHLEREFFKDMWCGFSLHGRDITGLLGWILETWYDGPNKTAFADILTGVPKRTATMLENAALWRLSELIRKSPSLLAAFREHRGEAFFRELDRSAEGKQFINQYRQFLTDFGHRGQSDRDIFYPRRAEDPSIDYNSLSAFLSTESPIDPEERERLVNESRERSVAAVADNIAAKPLGMLKVSILKKVHAYVQEFLMYRDNERDLADRITLGIKNGLLEASHRLRAGGFLAGELDYLFLTVDELLEVLVKREPSPLIKAKIAGRSRDVYRLQNKEYEPSKYMKAGKPISFDAEQTLLEDGSMQGVGTSGGKITGDARVIRTLKDIGRVKKGDILVVHATDPGWTPVFMLISGIVLETGGMLAHGSCLAREYGLPAVQIDKAMDLIPDGSRLTIAGDTGRVLVHQ